MFSPLTSSSREAAEPINGQDRPDLRGVQTRPDGPFPISAIKTVRVGTVSLHALGEAELVQHIVQQLQAGSGGWLVNPNVDVLRQVDRDPRLRDLLGQATLVVCDGAPVQWAAALSGNPIPARVPGSTLIWTLSGAARHSGLKVFLLGGAPGVGERAAAALEAAAPHPTAINWHCPPLGFEHDAAEQVAIRTALRAARPDVVFCGLGFPKQEWLMAELAQEFPRTWFIGSGASLTFAAGDVARAPRWMQRAGLEWVFRLVCEPKRLAKRYLVHDVPYAVRLLTRALAGRVRPRPAESVARHDREFVALHEREFDR